MFPDPVRAGAATGCTSRRRADRPQAGDRSGDPSAHGPYRARRLGARAGTIPRLPRSGAAPPPPLGRLGYRAAAGHIGSYRRPRARSRRAINALLTAPACGSIGLDRFTAFGHLPWVACEGRDDDRELSVEAAGRAISFSVGCFFQSNLAALQDLARHAAAAAGSGGAAADLYAGVGLFSALMAGGDRVVAVESSAQALSFATRNAAPTGLEAFPMTVEQWITAGAAGGPFEAVIVDPPRAGLAGNVRCLGSSSAHPRTLVLRVLQPW